MSRSNKLKLSLTLGSTFLILAAAGCASGGSGSPSSSASGQGPAFAVASMLAGTYQLRHDDSDARLQISSTGGTGSTVDLLATVSGKLDGRDVRQQEVIRLASEGPDVRMTLIPRFTPVTELSPDATDVSESELRAACTLYLQADGERWVGTTPGQGACIQAVTGAAGQWQMEVLPGAVRFTQAGTQQALVFQKTGDAVSR